VFAGASGRQGSGLIIDCSIDQNRTPLGGEFVGLRGILACLLNPPGTPAGDGATGTPH
jgi:hypothetical protein